MTASQDSAGGQRLEEMGIGRGGDKRSKRAGNALKLADTGVEPERSRRWYNIKRIPADCYDPMKTILPELLTSDFLATSVRDLRQMPHRRL